MPTIRHRVEKLEGMFGATDFERWLKAASEEELQEKLREYEGKMRVYLKEERGIDADALPSEELHRLVRQELRAELSGS